LETNNHGLELLIEIKSCSKFSLCGGRESGYAVGEKWNSGRWKVREGKVSIARVDVSRIRGRCECEHRLGECRAGVRYRIGGVGRVIIRVRGWRIRV
jgi:hypothetical protein